MYASMHCVRDRMAVAVSHWHKGSKQHYTTDGEYMSILVNDGCSEVTLFLSPEQAAQLETAIGQCLRDRAAVLSETPDDDETVYIGLDGTDEPEDESDSPPVNLNRQADEHDDSPEDGCGGGPVG